MTINGEKSTETRILLTSAVQVPIQARVNRSGQVKLVWGSNLTDLATHILDALNWDPLDALVAFALLYLMLFILSGIWTRNNPESYWRGEWATCRC